MMDIETLNSSDFMYQSSVPVFGRYLSQMNIVLDRLELDAARLNLSPDELLQARLAPDMFACADQLAIACNFVFRCCAPLAQMEIPAYGNFDSTLAGLRQRIASRLSFIQTLTPVHMQGSEARLIHADAGQAQLHLPGMVFLHQYMLPNFIFHLSSAYAILRQQGLALGKADFDGFHVYPRAS
ncbi:DUF1993 domain-containing protein [Undibacterium parvum]|uniref:DUF1993 domain-containing protein n=2 Tax=Undibacterium parvum TaxID=401471 RepID=A0A3S9HHE2_9BURK|nr:DUF1993 domain-containing protein [Undibacterium parvum]